MGVVTFTFTASGTWAKPANLVGVYARIQAAGGGGGYAGPTSPGGWSAGNGGGGGNYREAWIPAANLGATEDVTVGTGGQGGTSSGGGSGRGDDGTESLFAGINALGGRGGDAENGAFANGPFVGLGTGTVLDPDASLGSAGGPSMALSTSNVRGGAGGASVLGGASRMSVHNGTGRGSNIYGAGGGGASNGSNQANARNGGNGAPGIIIVHEYF